MRALAFAVVVAGCGGNPPAHVVAVDRVTIEIEPSPAGVRVLLDGEPVWTTRRGDRGAPYGFAATGGLDVETDEEVGSYQFTEGDPQWQGIDELGSIADVDGGATFTLRRGGKDVGTGTIGVVGLQVSLKIVADDAQQVSLGAVCGAGEHFVGLGGQSWDVDHRGQTVPLWVQEDGIGKLPDADDDYQGVWFLSGRRHSTHTPMPMMLSSAGYALVVDGDARTTFELCSEAKPDTARFSAWDKKLDVELFLGDGGKATDALRQMIAWVGVASRPPLHAFFPWVDAIFGSASVRAVAQAIRDNGVAAGTIWTEDWRGGNDTANGYALRENWRVDRTLYPDFEQVADDLHAAGFAFLTYFNSFVDDTADVYAEATAGGYAIHDASGAQYELTGVTFGKTTMIDLTSPEAVAWTRGVMAENVAQGADGWMADFAEWLPVDAKLTNGGDAFHEHQLYPNRWARLNHELLAPGSSGAGRFDPIYFTRSAWLHAQPDTMVLWPGDQQTDWSDGDGLPSVIPMGIGLGIAGFPYFGGDIAGYMSETTVPTTEELFYRWTTFGAFQPIMRTHHGRSARENFQWQHDANSIAHFRRWTRFHAQLAAYLYGSAAAYEQQGLPLLRLVALEFPDADWAWSATDEYMLGDRILVAPIQVQGAASRDVMLPAGTQWYPLFGGAPIEGSNDTPFTATASPSDIPVFVPAGTLLVLYPDGTTTPLPTKPSEDREVWLYPGIAQKSNVGVWGKINGAPTGADDSQQFGWGPGTGAATTATFVTSAANTPIALTQGAGYLTGTVVGSGTLTFDDGGLLAIDATGTTTIRLYTH